MKVWFTLALYGYMDWRADPPTNMMYVQAFVYHPPLHPPSNMKSQSTNCCSLQIQYQKISFKAFKWTSFKYKLTRLKTTGICWCVLQWLNSSGAIAANAQQLPHLNEIIINIILFIIGSITRIKLLYLSLIFNWRHATVRAIV